MAGVTSAASAAAARIGAALSDAQYFESSMVRVEDIRRQLDSRSVKEKLDAMKRVVALISLGKDASTFFPDVVKNVVAPSLDVKKLVYLYLVHYAEEKQDLALLAINSFQKDLSDHNQHIRALSLRVLSAIRVKVILQVVILAINKSAKDSSSYVRKAAAHAIGKVCALDSASKELLLQPLQDLVSDRSTQVLGSAIAAFEEVCPYNFTIIHPHYRRICNSLVEVDPWGQIPIINMLLRYARIHFADPYSSGVAEGTHRQRNSDLTLLLESVAPLFCSMNNSVVASSVAVFYHLGTKDEFCTNAIKPLMRLVAVQDDGGQAVALNIAAAVAVRYPSALLPYVSEFYISAAHTSPIRVLRMTVLTRICAAAGESGGIGSMPHARRALLAELKEYLFRRDKELAASSARAIGSLATAHPGSTPAIVKVLSSVVRSANNPSVVTESIGVLRRLLQRHPSAQTKALPQLIALLLASGESEKDSIQEPAARASVIWLIGEFYEKVQIVATEALRLLARGFVREAAEVKLQILNLAAKVVAWNESGKEGDLEQDLPYAVPDNVRLKLLEYVISCAKYDRDYDVRDKARMFQLLFVSNANTSLFSSACKAFVSRKPIPESVAVTAWSTSDEDMGPDVIIGSLAHVLTGRRLSGFRPLERWAEEDTVAALRDEVEGGAQGSSFTREYKGVSSSDYQGMVSTTNISSTVWEPPTGISSAAANVNGGSMAAGASSIGVSANLGMPIQQGGPYPNRTAVDTAVDPERFYDTDDSSDPSMYDTSSEDDDASDDTDLGMSTTVREPRAGAGVLINTETASKAVSATPSKKPTSEYDIDALLGSLSVSQMPSENKSAVSDAPGDRMTQSPWTRIVDSWKANGLEIDAAFVRTASVAGPDVTPVVLRVTNRGETALADVSFLSQSGDCFSSRNAIAALAPSQTKEVKADVRFRGKTTGVRFAIHTDGNITATGEFKPPVGFVIRPHPSITPGNFLSAEQSLRGMFGSESTVTLSQPKNSDWMGLSTIVREQLLEICFLSHVKTSVGGQRVDDNERFSIAFAGYLPSTQIAAQEKRPVFVRVTVRSGEEGSACACQLWVGCEDVLFSANLMQVCKTALLSIDKSL